MEEERNTVVGVRYCSHLPHTHTHNHRHTNVEALALVYAPIVCVTVVYTTHLSGKDGGGGDSSGFLCCSLLQPRPRLLDLVATANLMPPSRYRTYRLYWCTLLQAAARTKEKVAIPCLWALD